MLSSLMEHFPVFEVGTVFRIHDMSVEVMVKCIVINSIREKKFAGDGAFYC